jgi:hypothetical protein
VSRGRGRSWHLRLEPCSVPRDGHKTQLRQQAGCDRLGAGDVSVDDPARGRDSRRPCYSPLRYRVTRMEA